MLLVALMMEICKKTLDSYTLFCVYLDVIWRDI
jgi:hypothetical protein